MKRLLGILLRMFFRPLAATSLNFETLRGSQLCANFVAYRPSFIIQIRGSKVQPEICLSVILWNPFAQPVRQTEVGLTFCKSLCTSDAVRNCRNPLLYP
jgi:hypothetical protein